MNVGKYSGLINRFLCTSNTPNAASKLPDRTSSFVLEAVTGMPAAAFLDLISLSLSLSSGSGINNELIALRTFRGAGNGAGVPSHGGRCVDLVHVWMGRSG